MTKSTRPQDHSRMDDERDSVRQDKAIKQGGPSSFKDDAVDMANRVKDGVAKQANRVSEKTGEIYDDLKDKIRGESTNKEKTRQSGRM